MRTPSYIGLLGWLNRFFCEKFMKRSGAALKNKETGNIICPGEMGFSFHALHEFLWINCPG